MNRQIIDNPLSPGQSLATQPIRLWPVYLQALALCFLVALLAGLTVWRTDNAFTHAVAELGCIFVALGIFFAAWYGRDWADSASYALGLGYLAVAMLDGFHTYFFPTMQTAPVNAFDLGSWFWVCGRLLEACILHCAVRSSTSRNFASGLLLTICGSAVFSLALIKFSHLLPRLLTESGGVTLVKRWLEYAIIAVLLAAWRSVSRAGSDQTEYMRPWILLSISCTISSELCLAGYGTLTGFLHAFGHSLKAASYYFLFRGTFALSIRLPFERLAAAEHDLGNLLNNLPLGIITTSDTGCVSFANRVALSLLQGDFADGCWKKLDNSLATLLGTAAPSETQTGEAQADREAGYSLPDGRSLRVASVSLPEDNRVVFLEEDVSVLRQRRLRLQARNILNALSDLCVLVDQQRLILACNDAFLGLVGLPANDVEGTDFDRLWCSLGAADGLSDQPGKQLREHLVRGANGEARNLLVRCTAIDEPKGVGRVQMIVGSDVTRLRSQEDRMRQEENQAAIGQIAAGLVHEIRNPLTAVKGYNQLLGLSLTDLRLSEYSSTIQKEITELQSIVSELLEFSKPRPRDLRVYALGFTQLIMRELTDPRLHRFTEIMEREIGAVERIINNYLLSSNPGAPDLRSRPVSEVTGSLAAVCERVARLHETEFACVMSAPEGLVAVDLGQLAQMALNMAQNACEAMQGVAHPRLQLLVSAADEYVRMSIKDNGPGIDLADLSRLGTPFFTTKASGTGLGLSVCYQIARAHAGHVEAESQPGVGTTFHVLLPLARALVSQ